VPTHSADSVSKASSNTLNRQSSLYSLAGAPAKKTLNQWYSWALAFSFLLGLMAVPPSAQGQTFSVLYSFASEADGDRPDSLIRDAAGNLYGTTYYGGFAANGTVFKLDTTGKKTVLYRFRGQPDGDGPDGVVRDAADNLYGATSFGGSGCPGQHGCGTVFKLDASGKETVLHRFGGKGDGTFPTAGVIRDAAGNLYGTTYTGGVLSLCQIGCGTIFKVDASGKETVLYRFRNGADGQGPYGGLIRDGAGNLYGTTQAGGANSYGTVFKLDANGKLTVLHSLTIEEGCYSSASLFRDATGNLYGTTSSCGEFGAGTVFKVAPSGRTTVLHTFTGGTDGGFLYGPVLQDKAGKLYGSTGFGGDLTSPLCTESGNTPGCGVVFEIDTAGQYTVLHDFDGTDGQWAYYGVIRDSEGNLYGTTALGGTPTCFCGAVFKIAP
jgi:uncharacterized repeat protein (TIGR03803 family)